MKRATGAHQEKPGLISILAYAKRRGVSHTAVLKAIRDGRISTVGPKRRIDPEVADREWRESTDLTKSRNSVTGTSGKKRRGEDQTLNFNSARAVHETYKARKAKLEFEQMKGRLVLAEDVRRRWFTIGRRIRESVMGVADRVAPVVTGMSDSAEVHRIISSELRTALEELSHEPDR
jgi:hypothetical protein